MLEHSIVENQLPAVYKLEIIMMVKYQVQLHIVVYLYHQIQQESVDEVSIADWMVWDAVGVGVFFNIIRHINVYIASIIVPIKF